MTSEIKVGDKVRVRKDAPRVYLRDWCKAVEYDVYAVDVDAAIITYGYQEIAIPLKYLVKVEDEKKEGKYTKTKGDTLTFPIVFDLTEGFWHTCTADLAKEIALKVANKYTDPKEAAEYVIKVTKAVVEGLKRK